MGSIALQEWWDVQYYVEKLDNPKYFARVVIIIRNHSPYERIFEYYLKEINLRDQLNLLRFYLYTGLNARNKVRVEKYSKEWIEFKIPKMLVQDDVLTMVIGIRRVDNNEEKVIELNIPIK